MVLLKHFSGYDVFCTCRRYCYGEVGDVLVDEGLVHQAVQFFGILVYVLGYVKLFRVQLVELLGLQVDPIDVSR